MNQPQTTLGTYSQWPERFSSGLQRITWKPAHFFWVMFFLSPLFIARIFIGGAAESYDEFNGIGFSFLGYGVHAIVVIYYLAFAKHRPNTKQISYLIIVGLILSSIFHAALLTFSDEPGMNYAILAIARNTMWVIACVAIANITDQESFLKGLLWFCYFTFAVIILTSAIYFATGFPINLILSGSFPRAQGLMTEPSAVSGILGGFTALALARKQKWRVVLALTMALLVNSVIAIMAVCVGLITGWLSRTKTSRRFVGPVRLVFLLVFPVVIVVAPLYSHEISQTAIDAMNYFDGTNFGQTAFYNSIVLRFLQALSVLESGLDKVAQGDNQIDGGLFRFTSVVLLLNQMTDGLRWLVGFGIGAHAQLMIGQNQSILDFGLLPFIISSYGFVFGALIFLLLLRGIASRLTPLLLFVTPFAAVTILNSAGGIHAYSVVLVATLLSRTESPSL